VDLASLRTIVGRSLRAARLEAYRTRRELAAPASEDEDAGAGDVMPGGEVDLPDLGSRGAEVVLYFADGPENVYQVQQWLPILEELDRRHPTIVLCRDGRTCDVLRRETGLPVTLVRAFRDLEPVYRAVDAKVCLYVNAHPRNFQSLTFTDLLHVHLNHGESDKISMASNQAKAYDRVIVAGDAAVERYRLNLLDYDGHNLVKVGRPQLDLMPPHRAADGGRRTVVYAPTWEGGRSTMDYSSVRTMGPAIVEGLLTGGYRVVYRPHPKTGVHDRAVAAANAEVAALVEAAGDPHRVSADEPLHDALAEADVLIADISSVTLEFLPTSRPFFVTRPPRSDGALLDAGTTTDRIGYPLPPDALPDLAERVASVLAEDPRLDERRRLVTWYFGDTAPGASTRRFLDAIGGMVAERDRLLEDKHARLGGG
jgi:hypothetical protein